MTNLHPGVPELVTHREPPVTELFLIPDEVSTVLRASRDDLKNLRDAGQGPAYFTIGSTIRYLQADVDHWRAELAHSTYVPKPRSRGEGC